MSVTCVCGEINSRHCPIHSVPEPTPAGMRKAWLMMYAPDGLKAWMPIGIWRDAPPEAVQVVLLHAYKHLLEMVEGEDHAASSEAHVYIESRALPRWVSRILLWLDPKGLRL